MANLFNNRINAELANAAKDIIIQNIAEIRAQLPFLIGLNEKERQSMPKISRNNYLFVKDVLREIQYLPQVIPPYINVAQATKDLLLHEQLRDVEEQMDNLTTSIMDTRTLAGSESYSVALSIYDNIKRAAKDGVPEAREAYARLKPRFENQGRKKKKNEEASNNDAQDNIEKDTE